MDFPKHTIYLVAQTDGDPQEPTSAWQYAVLDGGGKPHVYGDQGWVAHGGAVRDCHPDGRVVRRRITFAYGPWEGEDAPSVEEQLRATGIPLADPVDPAEIEAEADAINALWEAERSADRLTAGIVDSTAVTEAGNR